MSAYSTSGTSIPPMLGRKKLFDRVNAMLSKSTPDHVSLVGPKCFGKSVFLKQLVKHHSSDSKFLGAIFIDLRHHCPESDAEFVSTVGKAIGNGIKETESEIAKILHDGDYAYDMIELAFGELEKKSQKLRIVFDNFDYLPLGTGINPNLLDQLRNLAQMSSLSIVTASRRRLRDVCKTEAARTSDFWRICRDPPVQTGCFGQNDLDDLFAPLTDKGFDVEKGAMTELLAQTGGIPILTIHVLERLANINKSNKTITQQNVVEICQPIAENPPDVLSDLWEDLTIEAQHILFDSIS